jgi:hypothetical protein
VTVLRPPAEIVGSKRAYYNDGLQDASGVAAWLNMLLGTEQATRGSARVFVRYHDVLQAWEPAITRIGSALDLPTLAALADDQRAAVSTFVDPDLRRVGLTWEDLALPQRLEEMARASWGALDGLAGPGQDDDAAMARLDACRAAYDAYYQESELVSRSSVIAAREQVMRTPTRTDPEAGVSGLLRRVQPTLGRAVPRPLRVRAQAIGRRWADH